MPYGFETSTPLTADRTKKEDTFTIGFVGRLDIHTKGLDLLVEAFSKFQEKQENSRLWIVGDGKQRLELKNIIASKGLRNVQFWGSQFGSKKEEIMQSMDVFAHPSRNEGLPVAVLEASSMGIPTVVSEATNIGDPISLYNSGLAIENENSDALCQAFFEIKSRWDQNTLGDMSQNALKMIKQEFAWRRIIHHMDELYQ